jgi:lysophospholipase L1-like esterase
LLDYQIKDYRTGNAKLDANITLQALFIAVTVLLILRRSDSLSVLGNAVPLSWLHVFVPVVIGYLWLAFGFILHDQIYGRLRGVEIMNVLHPATVNYQKALFRDSAFIDGWFVTFVDKEGAQNYSGIDPHYYTGTAFFLVVVLGTLVSAAHGSLMAIASIGCRRYLSKRSKRRLFWYYAVPVVPLLILVVSHWQFAFGGGNRNSLQLYVAAASVPCMAFLLWLSAVIDRSSYPESLWCLRRMRQLKVPGALGPMQHGRRTAAEDAERTISLIGDSLSTAFHVGSWLGMLYRMWRGWRMSWFFTLNNKPSVLERLSAIGPMTGVQHASVSARVDGGKRRTVFDRLKNTRHFSHQVDEVLAGPFPDMVLIWIGHNEMDWRGDTDALTPDSVLKLSNDFVQRYERQLRRLVTGALASNTRTVIIVFGLVNFAAFFEGRAKAEGKKEKDPRLFPYLQSCYRYFESMRPEYRTGMIELSKAVNQSLADLCQRLAGELAETNVRLVHSDALAKANLSEAEFLSPVDAWHPSPIGHTVLAESAYPIVCDQARFLGWN